MRKFYTLVLSAVLALSASAQGLTGTQSPIAKMQRQFSEIKQPALELTAPSAIKPMAATTADQVAGDYEVTYVVELTNGSPYSGEMTVTKGTAENTVIFNFPFINGTSTFNLALTGTLDPSTGIITISSKQASGYTGAELKFRHWNGSAWEDITEISATFTGKAIVFDADDAIGLMQSSSGGYYTLFDTITMDKIVDDPNTDPNEGWVSKGNAKFVDPWILTAFTFNDGSNQFDHEYEVELQQNIADPNTYRLVDPFKSNPILASYNTFSSTKHGYIQFNISDPDHVYFDVVEADFVSSQLGITKLYCYNILTYYANKYGYTPAQIVGILGDDLIYTTYKNGVINFTTREGKDDEGNATLENDACFSLSNTSFGAYSWTSSEGASVAMTGRITFPGAGESAIEGITTDAEAPVEYFNLQGMKIENPAAGQVVIRRQGSTVSKIIR